MAWTNAVPGFGTQFETRILPTAFIGRMRKKLRFSVKKDRGFSKALILERHLYASEASSTFR